MHGENLKLSTEFVLSLYATLIYGEYMF